MVKRNCLCFIFAVVVLYVFAVCVGNENNQVACLVSCDAAVFLGYCGVILACSVRNDAAALDFWLSGCEAGKNKYCRKNQSKIFFHRC